MKIALFGAPATGKTWLAHAITQALALNLPALEVHESPTFAALNGYELVLLMGLDLAITTGAHPGDQGSPGPQAVPAAARAMAEAQDTQLREALAHAGLSFYVVYGTGDARLANALAAIRRMNAPDLEASYAYSTRATGHFSSQSQKLWQWNCEKCSDPDCEHRLFTSLADYATKRPPAAV